MVKFNPFLYFNGNAEEAFNFYRSVFGGEFTGIMRYKDTPSSPQNMPISETDKEKVMHIALPVKGNTIMGADVLESMGQKFIEGNNFAIVVYPESEEDATTIFNALSIRGKIEMPLGKTFWGAFFGMCTDRFGINWMVNYENEKQ